MFSPGLAFISATMAIFLAHQVSMKMTRNNKDGYLQSGTLCPYNYSAASSAIGSTWDTLGIHMGQTLSHSLSLFDRSNHTPSPNQSITILFLPNSSRYLFLTRNLHKLNPS